MNLIKIILISLFLILVCTGITFAKSDITFDTNTCLKLSNELLMAEPFDYAQGSMLNSIELPAVSLGITLSSGVNPIIDDNGINFNLNRQSTYTQKHKKTSAIYKVKVIGVALTVVGVTSITIGVSTMFVANTLSSVLIIAGLSAYNIGIVMGLIGAIVDSSYSVNLGVGAATTIFSLISGGLGLLFSFVDELVGVAMAMPGAFLLIPGIILWIAGGVKWSKREPKNETYDYPRIELSIREEDGAIGLSW